MFQISYFLFNFLTIVVTDEQYMTEHPDEILDDRSIIEILCHIASEQYMFLWTNYAPKQNQRGKTEILYPTASHVAVYCLKSHLCKFIVWTCQQQFVLDAVYNDDFVSGPRI